MLEILDKLRKGKQPVELPMPIPGQILCFIYWWVFRWFWLPWKADYKTTIKALNTPLKVQAWLWANVRYKTDKPKNHWQTPRETFDLRTGDCEDWAAWALECLKTDYICYILCMYSKKSGHAECVVFDCPDDGDYHSVGTFGLHEHSGSYEHTIPDWSPFKHWTHYNVLDEDLDTVECGTKD